MNDRYRCSVASRDRDEPLYATASQVRRWILVEEPSGWGSDAVLQSRLPRDVALALRARARREGARLLLIRRHGRYETERRTCFVAVTTPEVQRVERVVVGHTGDLLDVEWERLGRDHTVGGEQVDEPLFLVCTNGRHDPCCSEFGRPVAQALNHVMPQALWEASHYGGDRFAGNLVCLPHGVYYGHVTPLNAVRIARDYASGVLHLDNYRGQSAYPFAVQAAEHFARELKGWNHLDDIAPAVWHSLADDVTHVEMSTVTGRLVVVVQAYADPEPTQLTCHADVLLHPKRYSLVSLEEAA